MAGVAPTAGAAATLAGDGGGGGAAAQGTSPFSFAGANSGSGAIGGAPAINGNGTSGAAGYAGAGGGSTYTPYNTSTANWSAGSGGAATFPGGGGGGGAMAANDELHSATSGAGGLGANGMVVVTTVYVVLFPATVAGGQQLTPNPNVTAVAGMGGDKWGANGGGINPIGGGVTGVQGWDERLKVTTSDGQRTTTYEVNPIPVIAKGAPTQSVLSQVSNSALSELSFDDTLPGGGSHAG
jgi:hypothetical protein